jgi:hypothetical protein
MGVEPRATALHLLSVQLALQCGAAHSFSHLTISLSEGEPFLERLLQPRIGTIYSAPWLPHHTHTSRFNMTV